MPCPAPCGTGVAVATAPPPKQDRSNTKRPRQNSAGAREERSGNHNCNIYDGSTPATPRRRVLARFSNPTRAAPPRQQQVEIAELVPQVAPVEHVAAAAVQQRGVPPPAEALTRPPAAFTLFTSQAVAAGGSSSASSEATGRSLDRFPGPSSLGNPASTPGTRLISDIGRAARPGPVLGPTTSGPVPRSVRLGRATVRPVTLYWTGYWTGGVRRGRGGLCAGTGRTAGPAGDRRTRPG